MSFQPQTFSPVYHQNRYLIRLLTVTDSGKDYCQLLSHLTNCPSIPDIQFKELVQQMQPDRGYYVLIALDQRASPGDQTLVASVTLLVEQKIIHQGGHVGHIEDVVVSPVARGQGLAKVLLDLVRQIANEVGCYKLILDCESELEAFYQKLGYFKKGSYLRQNL